MEPVNTVQIAEMDKINEIKNAIVSAVKPEQVYLFGSFAKGTQTENSDYDFLVVVSDSVTDLHDVRFRAFRALRGIKDRRPLDILAANKTAFEKRARIGLFEKEIYNNGVRIYG